MDNDAFPAIETIMDEVYNLEEEYLYRQLEGKTLLTGDYNIYLTLRRRYPKITIFYSPAIDTEKEKVYLLDTQNPMGKNFSETQNCYAESCLIPLYISYTTPTIEENHVVCKVEIKRKDDKPL